MATATRGTPSGTARLTGRNVNGTTRWITIPETSEIRYTMRGRTRAEFAISPALVRGLTSPLAGTTDRNAFTKPPRLFLNLRPADVKQAKCQTQSRDRGF